MNVVINALTLPLQFFYVDQLEKKLMKSGALVSGFVNIFTLL